MFRFSILEFMLVTLVVGLLAGCKSRSAVAPCATRLQIASPRSVPEFPLPSGASSGCCARSRCKTGPYNDTEPSNVSAL